MPLKPILFLVAVSFLLSCGSTKEVANSKSETASKTETPNTTSKEQIETKTKVEIEKKSEIQTKTEASELEEQVPIKTTIVEEPTTNMKHNTWNSLLQKHVSSKGNVNYKGFKSDRIKFYAYIEELQKNAPQDSWSHNEKLTYWINAYNAFTVDLILRNYPLQSIKDIKDPWDQRLWKIGSKWYNLNDIEHQILRKMDEPRIHFAIVCASVSCPKLQNSAFESSNLDTQLTEATKEFLSDTSKNILSENSIKISKIFKWFSKDLKSKDSNLIDFLNQYLDTKISQNAKKSYLDYNWNLNE